MRGIPRPRPRGWLDIPPLLRRGELEPPPPSTPHPPYARHTFQKLPDVVAMTWAVGVVGSYFLLCLTLTTFTLLLRGVTLTLTLTLN